MASNFKRTALAVNAEADTIGALLDGGFVDLYAGTQPATADTAITTQTRLARLPLSDPAFQAAVEGVATANPITAEDSADATGTATFFRAVRSNGTTPVFDGSVGIADADCVLDRTDVQQGARVSATSMIYVANKG